MLCLFIFWFDYFKLEVIHPVSEGRLSFVKHLSKCFNVFLRCNLSNVTWKILTHESRKTHSSNVRLDLNVDSLLIFVYDVGVGTLLVLRQGSLGLRWDRVRWW